MIIGVLASCADFGGCSRITIEPQQDRNGLLDLLTIAGSCSERCILKTDADVPAFVDRRGDEPSDVNSQPRDHKQRRAACRFDQQAKMGVKVRRFGWKAHANSSENMNR